MSSSGSEAYNRPPFPTYLLPSISLRSREGISFRRRHSSTTSTSTYATSPDSDHSRRDSTWSPATTPSNSPPDASYLQTTPGLPNINSLTAAVSSTFTRKPSTTSTTSLSPTEPSDISLFRSTPDTLKCSTCATDLAFSSQIVSKGFTGRHGRAFLVAPPPRTPSTTTSYLHRLAQAQSGRATSEGDPKWSLRGLKAAEGNLINIKVGRNVNRQLVTGQHVVADITCKVCGTVVGWKYVDASEKAQMYKIGKFILETRRVVRGVGWEDRIGSRDEDEEVVNEMSTAGVKRIAEEEEVVFDSEDEDECEDLFAGVWDAEVAKKRRGKKLVAKRS